tara:strand:- start:49 stop:597 length:549 start_codon:yes stop_codon:yes gene_type:complete
MKHCHKCNISKPLSEFYKDKTMKDGLQNKCKECEKQYYQDNKESRLEYQNQYTQDNKEAIDKYNNQYREDNKEAITEYQRQLEMSEGYGVYTLTHLPTQCYYVGEGKIYDRRTAHFSLLKRGKNKYGLLQEHYNKHPNIDDWEFKVIRKWDEINKEAGLEVENKLIKWGFDNAPKEILNKTL